MTLSERRRRVASRSQRENAVIAIAEDLHSGVCVVLAACYSNRKNPADVIGTAVVFRNDRSIAGAARVVGTVEVIER